MAKTLSKATREALAATDWRKIDAMTDSDIARQIASNSDAAPDMAPEIDVRAIRRATGMTQAEFAAAYKFSVRTVQQWERGAKKPGDPARTLLRAIKADPEGLRKALAAV
jgi:putative transcriptional regulator